MLLAQVKSGIMRHLGYKWTILDNMHSRRMHLATLDRSTLLKVGLNNAVNTLTGLIGGLVKMASEFVGTPLELIIFHKPPP